MSEIKPAMTPEEWATKGLTTFSDSDRIIAPMPAHRHALAAMALKGQPFGFHPEDVIGLRDVARELRIVADDDHAMRPDIASECAALLDRIADTIAALLPPQP